MCKESKWRVPHKSFKYSVSAPPAHCSLQAERRASGHDVVSYDDATRRRRASTTRLQRERPHPRGNQLLCAVIGCLSCQPKHLFPINWKLLCAWNQMNLRVAVFNYKMDFSNLSLANLSFDTLEIMFDRWYFFLLAWALVYVFKQS